MSNERNRDHLFRADGMKTFVVNMRDRKQKEMVTVCIDRTTKWGNPFKIGNGRTREDVIRLYQNYINSPLKKDLKDQIVSELKGEVLGCWCAPLPCHGDVLAAIADGREYEELKR